MSYACHTYALRMVSVYPSGFFSRIPTDYNDSNDYNETYDFLEAWLRI